MSSDNTDTEREFDGSDKSKWKAFYDDAVRICRSELGSDGVKWFNGEAEEANQLAE